MVQVLGFIGVVMAVVAYLPQIAHVIKERCSAGLSLQTYYLWLISSCLLLINAIIISSAVFIIFQICNLVAISLIIMYGRKYQGMRCVTGFDHGVGHPLLLLGDAKIHNYRKNKVFKDLGHYSEWPTVADAVIEA